MTFGWHSVHKIIYVYTDKVLNVCIGEYFPIITVSGMYTSLTLRLSHWMIIPSVSLNRGSEDYKWAR